MAAVIATGLATVSCSGTISDGEQPASSAPRGQPGATPGAAARTAGGTGATGAQDPARTAGPAGAAGAAVGKQPLFRCDAALVPAEVPLRRLSELQLRNTVRALVARLAPLSASQILAAIDPVLNSLPKDSRVGDLGEHRGGFTRLDQAVQQEHVDVMYQLGTLLGAELTRTAARRTEVFGVCATDADASNDSACLETFLRDVGGRMLRRPLSPEDIAFHKSPTGNTPVDPAGLADVVALLVSSPRFLYTVEHGQGTAAQVPVDLGPFELASRLSYHFLQAPPDDALWTAASNGTLLALEGYRAQVERLTADPRFDTAMDEFFGEWLRLGDLPELDGLKAVPMFKAFAGTDMPGPDLREAMMADVLASARFEVRRGGTLSSLLSNKRSFATDPLLARIAGAPVWSGAGDPPSYNSPARVGLLTRPALLATGTANTRPIMKGFFIRDALMCQKLPPPPGDVNAVAPEPRATATTREAIEAITEVPGSNCAACHKPLLNPLGFATENFDALGRERSMQTIFDTTGRKLAERSVRTDSVPNILAGDDTTSRGAEDLTQLLDRSGRVPSCLTRQYFRHAFGRVEDEARDGCSLARLESMALKVTSLADVFREAAFLPAFKQRSFQ